MYETPAMLVMLKIITNENSTGRPIFPTGEMIQDERRKKRQAKSGSYMLFFPG